MNEAAQFVKSKKHFEEALRERTTKNAYYVRAKLQHSYIAELLKYTRSVREGVQKRHDPRKNDLRTSGFAELPPGPAKPVSQPQ